MARKEQDRGRQQSKSRAAMRTARGGQPAPVVQAPEPQSSGKGLRSKAKEGRGGCVVASCICASEYQDERYGANRRVFNVGPGGGKCTVCGAKKQF